MSGAIAPCCNTAFGNLGSMSTIVMDRIEKNRVIQFQRKTRFRTDSQTSGLRVRNLDFAYHNAFGKR